MNHDTRATAIYKFPPSNVSHTRSCFTLIAQKTTYKFPNIQQTSPDTEEELLVFNSNKNFLYLNHIKIDDFKGVIEENKRYYKIKLDESGTFIYEYDVSPLFTLLKSKILENNLLSFKLLDSEELSQFIECNDFNFEWVYFGKDYIKFRSESTKLVFNKQYFNSPDMGIILDEDLTRNIHFSCLNKHLCLFDGNKKYVFDTDSEIINEFQKYKLFDKKEIKSPFQVKILKNKRQFINRVYKTAFYEVNTYRIETMVLVAAPDGLYLLLGNKVVHKEVENILHLDDLKLEYAVYDNSTHEVINYSIIPLISFVLIHEDYEILNNNLILNKLPYVISIEAVLENIIIQVSNNKELKYKVYKKISDLQKGFLNFSDPIFIFKYTGLIKRLFRVTGDVELLSFLSNTPFDILNTSDEFLGPNLDFHAKFIDKSIDTYREDDLLEYILFLNENADKILKAHVKKCLVSRNCFYLKDLVALPNDEKEEIIDDELEILCYERIKKLEEVYVRRGCFRNDSVENNNK
ncbi:hypothetical protein CDIK_0089 [Cucumispora dikerogammari]|nr:hypothetical protein CDIK_0089 [Cucumispora dikerogammari]